MMVDWSGSLPLSKKQTIDTVCDGEVVDPTEPGGVDRQEDEYDNITYCDAELMGKHYKQGSSDGSSTSGADDDSYVGSLSKDAFTYAMLGAAGGVLLVAVLVFVGHSYLKAEGTEPFLAKKNERSSEMMGLP
jgi:hypothetical protein